MADTVIILNDKAVIAALNRAPDMLIAAIQPAVERWQLRRQAELARYPSPPPESNYTRGGTLGRVWSSAKPTWHPQRGGFESRIGNSTPYAVWVQGPTNKKPGQAKIHQGRWLSVTTAEEKAKPALEADVRQAADSAAQQINGVTR